MTEAATVIISGIKCDHCTYRDDDVKAEDYQEWLNRPCPECGENLLTEADFKAVQGIMGLADVINEAVGPVRDDAPVLRQEIKMNGTGALAFGKSSIVEGIKDD